MNKKSKKAKMNTGIVLMLFCTVLLVGIILAVTNIISTITPADKDGENTWINGSDVDPNNATQKTEDNMVPENVPQTPSQPQEPSPSVDENDAPEKEPDKNPPALTYPEGGDPADSIPVTNMEPWNLVLINPWNKLPADFQVKLTQLKNGHSVDERAYPELQQMMDDARAEGLSPIICSSFRTQKKQTTLFANQVNRYLDRGYEYDDAVAEAGTAVAIPGTSEHQLGLAVDIVALSYQLLDENQENTAEQKWLMENSYKYGWILRYPSDKSNITGIIYEPWHYRYVGKEAAKEIYEKGICLEEYLAIIKE